MYGLYNYYTVEWSELTFVFYLSIVAISYFLPKIKQKVSLTIGGKKFSTPIGILLVEGLLIFIKGFNTTGRDLISGYYSNFISASSMSAFRDQSVEKGYILLNVIVHNIVNKYWIFLFVVTLITVIPVFVLIKKYSNVIDVSVATFLYTAIYFFPGLSLIRISLASSIALLSFDAAIEKKPIKALFGIILASFFHISMLCLLIPYTMMFARRMDKKLVFITAAGLFTMVYFNQVTLVSLLTGRYSVYSLADSGLGFEQLIYYLPMFLLLWWQKKHVSTEKKDFYTISFSYILSGLFMGMMQYVLPALGRTYVAFLPLSFIIAYYVKSARESMRYNRKALFVLVFVYGIFRFYVFISQCYNTDDIMPYMNVFGWRF